MRPYSIRNEDGKYIHAIPQQNITNQPSPLALLAATCSKIGDTFPSQDTNIFTPKDLAFDRGKSNSFTSTKSCVDIRPSAFVCMDQNYSLKTLEQANLNKIKYESDIISRTRDTDTQARAIFSKTTCSQVENLFDSDSFPSCEHISSNDPVVLPPEQSSCFYDNDSCMSSQSSQSSCAVEEMNFQGSALHNLQHSNQNVLSTISPIIIPSTYVDSITSNYSNYTTNKQFLNAENNYSSIKQYHNVDSNYAASKQDQQWPNYRHQQNKSSCMIQDDFDNNNLTMQTNMHRTTRSTSLSHMSSPVIQPMTPTPHISPNQHLSANTSGHVMTPPNLSSSTSPHPGTPATPQFISPHNNINNFPNQHAFSHYSANNTPVEIKQEPSYLMPTTFRQTPVSPYSSMNYPPQNPGLKWAGNPSLRHPHDHSMMSSAPQNESTHNHPAGMSSSFCPTCNSHSYPQMSIPPHEMMVNNRILPSDMQSMADYQYQQQQMFFARDNRRPRRIACTCPNCRDGENKTVTTKDGKQRKLHVCHVPGCGKIYGKTSHLRAHLRWHAGERPFACNWLFCNKRFTRSDELQRHRRTHTGDKRFECSTCLKKFMRSDHLSKHMKTHQAQNKKTEEKIAAEKKVNEKPTVEASEDKK